MDHCFGSFRTRFLKAVRSAALSVTIYSWDLFFRKKSHAASGFDKRIWNELEKLNTSSVPCFCWWGSGAFDVWCGSCGVGIIHLLCALGYCPLGLSPCGSLSTQTTLMGSVHLVVHGRMPLFLIPPTLFVLLVSIHLPTLSLTHLCIFSLSLEILVFECKCTSQCPCWPDVPPTHGSCADSVFTPNQ